MKHIVIIGNCAAGIAAAEAIRKRDRDSKLTIISDENYSAYYRCIIPNLLADDIKEKGIFYRDEAFYKENKIDLLLNKKAIEIRDKKNIVVVRDAESSEAKKEQVKYDALILANGASPKFPDKKGMHKKGVFGFRTIEDTIKISELLPITTTTCILGGGLIGLKAAYALKKRGLEVKVIIRSNQVLSQVLDREAGDMFQKLIEQNGIEVMTGTDVSEIIGNGDVKAVKLSSGKVIGCSIVVVGKGVKPNIDLVKDTEIEVSEGIVVDDHMRTNIPNIYAAGDVCQTYDPALDQKVVNALWPNAIEQGKIAGVNLCGEGLKYDGSIGMNSVEFFGLPMISMGITRPREEGYQELVRKGENIYKKLVLKDSRLVGGIFVGKLNNAGVYLDLIKKRVDISSIIDRLLDINFSYANAFELLGKEDNRYVEITNS